MTNHVRTVSLTMRIDVADSVLVWQRFLEAVNRLSVTVMGTCHHSFPGSGFSGLVLLGESHAAIHTWPEDGTAWVELATCGDAADLAAFQAAMQAWEAECGN